MSKIEQRPMNSGWGELVGLDVRGLKSNFGLVIDVREPSAFWEDHIPGSSNGYTANDEESKRIRGLECEAEADALAESVAKVNVDKQLACMERDLPSGGEVLLYGWWMDRTCEVWRQALNARGLGSKVLKGGFEGYRVWVDGQLQSLGRGLNYNVIMGPAGSGKTELLRALSAMGEQVLDLEQIVTRFGGKAGEGSKKLVESYLAVTLEEVDPSRPIWIEGVFSGLGNDWLPASMVENVKASMRGYLISGSMDQRAQRWCESHAMYEGGSEGLFKSIMSDASLKEGGGSLKEVSKVLMEEHYDKMHASQLRGVMGAMREVIRVDVRSNSKKSIMSAAAQLALMG